MTTANIIIFWLVVGLVVTGASYMLLRHGHSQLQAYERTECIKWQAAINTGYDEGIYQWQINQCQAVGEPLHQATRQNYGEQTRQI